MCALRDPALSHGALARGSWFGLPDELAMLVEEIILTFMHNGRTMRLNGGSA